MTRVPVGLNFVAKSLGTGGGFTPEDRPRSPLTGRQNQSWIRHSRFPNPVEPVHLSMGIYIQWKRTVLPVIVLVKRVPLYLVFYSSTAANTSTRGRNKTFVLKQKQALGNGTSAGNSFRLSSANFNDGKLAGWKKVSRVTRGHNPLFSVQVWKSGGRAVEDWGEIAAGGSSNRIVKYQCQTR
jgi:hypothetical protein